MSPAYSGIFESLFVYGSGLPDGQFIGQKHSNWPISKAVGQKLIINKLNTTYFWPFSNFDRFLHILRQIPHFPAW
jgi:hypothetical protein